MFSNLFVKRCPGDAQELSGLSFVTPKIPQDVFNMFYFYPIKLQFSPSRFFVFVFYNPRLRSQHSFGKISRDYFLSIGTQQNSPFQNIFQFSYIPRPIVGSKQCHRFL